MKFPENLRYTKNHEWIKVENDIVTIGITEFAQQELGDIVFVDINTVGKQVNQDEIFGTIEAVKTVSDLFMPISGKVLESNAAIENMPEIINQDPYEKGWIIKVQRVADEAIEHNLLSAEQYKALISSS